MFVFWNPCARAKLHQQKRALKLCSATLLSNNQVFSFVSRCGRMWCRSRRLDCILLVFIRRKCRLVTSHLLSRMLRCYWLVFSSCNWCIFILAVSVCCTLGGPLLYDCRVVVFFDRGHPCFRCFYSTIPVDVVRVRSYVVASLTLRAYLWGSRSINFTSFQSGLCSVW